MFKKKNYKIIVGIMVGIFISTGVVVAASYKGTASDMEYDNKTSGLSSSNVQDALDELYELKDSSNCPSGYYCEKLKTELELGDYVSYTPEKTSYTTDTTYTGYSSSQTIKPSELNLWRVLNINSDGTFDLISEYVSSTNVYFKGKIGYLNFVGYLNVLAEQYETEGITSGSRYFGYNGQTEFIKETDTTDVFVNPAPWACSTGGTCNPDPDDYEEKGGGDTLYTTDYNQVNTVLGTRVANQVGTSTATSYWMASRYYNYSSSTIYNWHGRRVEASGSLGNNNLYYYYSSSFSENNSNNALRPIVTLKSGLLYEGLGTELYPMRIKAS